MAIIPRTIPSTVTLCTWAWFAWFGLKTGCICTLKSSSRCLQQLSFLLYLHHMIGRLCCGSFRRRLGGIPLRFADPTKERHPGGGSHIFQCSWRCVECVCIQNSFASSTTSPGWYRLRNGLKVNEATISVHSVTICVTPLTTRRLRRKNTSASNRELTWPLQCGGWERLHWTLGCDELAIWWWVCDSLTT